MLLIQIVIDCSFVLFLKLVLDQMEEFLPPSLCQGEQSNFLKRFCQKKKPDMLFPAKLPYFTFKRDSVIEQFVYMFSLLNESYEMKYFKLFFYQKRKPLLIPNFLHKGTFYSMILH